MQRNLAAGIDGGHLGIADGIAGDFIKLKKRDGLNDENKTHHEYIGLNLVNDAEGHNVAPRGKSGAERSAASLKAHRYFRKYSDWHG